MTVSFSSNTNHNKHDPCPICLLPLNKKGVLTHNSPSGKQVHAIHEKCIRTWAKIHPSCPSCREPIHLQSLLSWEERVWIACKGEIRNIVSKVQRGLQTEKGLNVISAAIISLGSITSVALYSKILPEIHSLVRI